MELNGGQTVKDVNTGTSLNKLFCLRQDIVSRHVFGMAL